MNRKRLIPVLVLVLAAVGGYLYWHRQRQQAVPGDRLVLYGNVDIREAQLAFNAAEHIQEILVQEGDRVHQGQLLARLHATRLQAALDQAKAALDAQRQVVARMEAGSRPEEIARGRAQLAAAKARSRAATDTYHRLERLLDRKLVSPDDVEAARSRAEAAAHDVEAARQTLALLVAGPRKEDIAAARAELAARAAAVRLAQERLADTRLFAPADGTIRDRILEPGDMVSPQTPVLTLAFTDPVWVRAYVPEPDLGRVRPGMKADITTDSFPGKHYTGWVGYVSPTAEFTPKNVETPELRTRLVYQARIYACNPAGELRLGMPATVTIALDQPPGAARGGSPCGD